MSAEGVRSSRAVRPRALTPGQAQRLEALRRVSQLLDSAFVLPGTSQRIGLDPIIGLVPVIGDLTAPLFTIGLLWQGLELGIPKVVQLRMILNTAIDALVGVIPIGGDIFDLAWRANQMNLALLERHAYEVRPPSAADWWFVIGMTALVVAIAAVPFLVALWLLSALGRLFG